MVTIRSTWVAILVKNKSAEMADALRWSQTVIDLAGDDPTKGNLIVGSPLAVTLASRGIAKMWLGVPGWREDLDRAVALARGADAMSHAVVITYKYIWIPSGVLVADDIALRQIDEALQMAERSGDDFALALTRQTMGLAAIITHGSGWHACSATLYPMGVSVKVSVRSRANQQNASSTPQTRRRVGEFAPFSRHSYIGRLSLAVRVMGSASIPGLARARGCASDAAVRPSPISKMPVMVSSIAG